MSERKNHSKAELRHIVLRYLAGNKLMTLGTSRLNRPWGATVFFAFNKDFTILFYSRGDTRHSRHIAKNSYVSVVINEDHGKRGFVKGLQLTGKAEEVPSHLIKRYYSLYHARYPWADKFPDHLLYRIIPKELHYIDQKYFGHFFRVKIL